jgi:hypothetical protein
LGRVAAPEAEMAERSFAKEVADLRLGVGA